MPIWRYFDKIKLGFSNLEMIKFLKRARIKPKTLRVMPAYALPQCYNHATSIVLPINASLLGAAGKRCRNRKCCREEPPGHHLLLHQGRERAPKLRCLKLMEKRARSSWSCRTRPPTVGHRMLGRSCGRPWRYCASIDHILFGRACSGHWWWTPVWTMNRMHLLVAVLCGPIS